MEKRPPTTNEKALMAVLLAADVGAVVLVAVLRGGQQTAAFMALMVISLVFAISGLIVRGRRLLLR